MQSQQKFSTPTPSSASVPSYKNKYYPKVGKKALYFLEVFHAPRLSLLSLCLVRTIHVSSSLERKDALGAASAVTTCGIFLLDRVKEVVMVKLSLQLQQH